MSCFATSKSFNLPSIGEASDAQGSLLLQGSVADTPHAEKWDQGIRRFSLGLSQVANTS